MKDGERRGTTANERRRAILEKLCARRYDTRENLATEFNVSERTIERDIVTLTLEYPLYTVQGNGGGIYVESRREQRSRIVACEAHNYAQGQNGNRPKIARLRDLVSAYIFRLSKKVCYTARIKKSDRGRREIRKCGRIRECRSVK